MVAELPNDHYRESYTHPRCKSKRCAGNRCPRDVDPLATSQRCSRLPQRLQRQFSADEQHKGRRLDSRHIRQDARGDEKEDKREQRNEECFRASAVSIVEKFGVRVYLDRMSDGLL